MSTNACSRLVAQRPRGSDPGARDDRLVPRSRRRCVGSSSTASSPPVATGSAARQWATGLACYLLGLRVTCAPSFERGAVQLLWLRGCQIIEIAGFLDPTVRRNFGLMPRIRPRRDTGDAPGRRIQRQFVANPKTPRCAPPPRRGIARNGHRLVLARLLHAQSVIHDEGPRRVTRLGMPGADRF